MKKRQKGQAILETAVILPVFIFISLGLIDIQWLLERAANLDYVVNEVARCQAIAGPMCSGSNTPTTYANLLVTSLRMDPKETSIVQSGCDSSRCTETMNYRYKAVGAWFPAVTIRRTGIAALPPSAT